MRAAHLAVTRRHILVGGFGAALAGIAPVGARGADRDDHERARRALERGEVLPLRSILEQLEREHPGQVLKIEFETDDGRYVYEVRLLEAGGNVVKLKLDATDGSVISFKRKRR